jgi:choline dehydrogenase
VILSAGAVASPQLLELSGIGNPEILKQFGIEVRHALPAVGENFRDHIGMRAVWKVKDPALSYNLRSRGLAAAKEAWKLLTRGTGFFSLPSAPLVAFLKTRPELTTPDIQLHLLPIAVRNLQKRELFDFPAMTISCYQLRPESLGSIHVRSANPHVPPAIKFNFLADRIDQQCMVDGFKIVRRIGEQRALDPYRGEEVVPGADVQTEAEVLDFIRQNSQTAYHPIGTCRMGPSGPSTVVDNKLKVHGIEGLRVADASIFPTMPSGNTNAPSIMVGERAADLIKQTA